jgi:hypothetical protein
LSIPTTFIAEDCSARLPLFLYRRTRKREFHPSTPRATLTFFIFWLELAQDFAKIQKRRNSLSHNGHDEITVPETSAQLLWLTAIMDGLQVRRLRGE